jgi:hypothetical protein
MKLLVKFLNNQGNNMFNQTIDRFTLEQQIMTCWSVVEDLQMVANRGEGTLENIQALSRIYQLKFETLFDTFEQLIAEGKII